MSEEFNLKAPFEFYLDLATKTVKYNPKATFNELMSKVNYFLPDCKSFYEIILRSKMTTQKFGTKDVDWKDCLMLYKFMSYLKKHKNDPSP